MVAVLHTKIGHDVMQWKNILNKGKLDFYDCNLRWTNIPSKKQKWNKELSELEGLVLTGISQSNNEEISQDG